MKDLEKVQKTLSDVFDYLNGNNLQLVGKELLTDVGDAHRIVENLAINDVVLQSEQLPDGYCKWCKQTPCERLNWSHPLEDDDE